MRDNVYCGMLNAYYGSLLTDYQREIMRLYYDCDMSLAEISELKNVSRQAVREIVVRSTKKLTDVENKLGLIGKIRDVKAELEKIIDGADGETKVKLVGLKEMIEEI